MFKKFHMVRTGLLFVVIAAGINLCFGQMYWTRSFDSEATPIVMKSTSDGNYIIAGLIYDLTRSYYTGWFAKLNPNGDTLWTKTFGESRYSIFYAIESIDEEFFLLIGGFSSVGVASFNGLIVKINTNGDIIWTKTYKKPGEFSDFRAIQKCTDGNFLIAGLSSIDGTNYSGSLLVKITPVGDTLWTKSSSGKLFSILASGDDDYLVAGEILNSISNEGQILLLKINNKGETIWTKNLRNSINQEACKIFPAGDGNYLLLGTNNARSLVLKISPEGDTIWTRTYSKLSPFTDIISSTNGDFLIIGSGTTITPFNECLLKINQNGDTLWTRTTGIGYPSKWYTDILPAGNGKFLVLETTLGKWFISCMVDDHYANKNSLFTFKIPTLGLDSLNFGYQPLKVPSSMTVSAGGTVSWTPQTDSSYLENPKFIVFNDEGRKDTLSFNIFVNIQNNTSYIRAKHQLQKDKVADFFTIASYLQRGKVQFNFPSSVEFLSIYDMSGRLIDRINPVSSAGRQTILWPATGTGFHSGQYIVQAVDGKKTEAKAFMLGR